MSHGAQVAEKVNFRPLRAQLEHFDCDVTVDCLAAVLDVSHETLRKQVNKGVIEKLGRGRVPFLDAIRSYLSELRATAAGRGGVDDSANLSRERARLATAQAEAQELKNAAAKGELIPALQVEALWATEFNRIRTALLAVPSRVATKNGHLSREDVNAIDAEIRRALTQLGHGHDESRADPGAGADAPGTAATPADEPVA